MPEGPEIRLAADSIAKALVNKTTTGVSFTYPHLKKFEKKLTGKKVVSVETRGKAILTAFENDLVIYSHNQLYGLWYVVRGDELPDTHRQLRLTIHNRGYSAFLYSASDIEVLEADQLLKHKFLSKLGPDLLSQNPAVCELLGRLESVKYRNRQLGNLLLDQGFVAGLGNYLRAEILFFSGLHPRLRPVDCCRDDLERLAAKMIRLTRRSYRTRGVINPPSLVRSLKAQGKTEKEQYRFSVYAREGKHCYICNDRIERIDSGGRHIYFCPNCQSLPG